MGPATAGCKMAHWLIVWPFGVEQGQVIDVTSTGVEHVEWSWA